MYLQLACIFFFSIKQCEGHIFIELTYHETKPTKFNRLYLFISKKLKKKKIITITKRDILKKKYIEKSIKEINFKDETIIYDNDHKTNFLPAV